PGKCDEETTGATLVVAQLCLVERSLDDGIQLCDVHGSCSSAFDRPESNSDPMLGVPCPAPAESDCGRVVRSQQRVRGPLPGEPTCVFASTRGQFDPSARLFDDLGQGVRPVRSPV